jgi:DNA-directed RNA polymerase specialized sigma24 family protein
MMKMGVSEPPPLLHSSPKTAIERPITRHLRLTPNDSQLSSPRQIPPSQVYSNWAPLAMIPQSVNCFRDSWEYLLAFAVRKGVFYQDAEDLVSATLHSALDKFSEDRGKFLPFCTTILNNKIKNYWRDKKPNDPFDDDIASGLDHADDLEMEEERARMKLMLDRIREQLDDEEEAVFNALGVALEDLESRAVSQAARSLGLDPEKGWDIFRRIQRKARVLFPAMKAVEGRAPQAPAAAPSMEKMAFEEPALYQMSIKRERPAKRVAPALPSLLDLARFARHEAGFAGLLQAMTEGEKSRLSSILG